MGSEGPEISYLDDCDFWCQTDGDKLEVDGGAGNRKNKFVWRVSKFSSIQAQKGDSIVSNSFSVISPEGVATKWRLKLFPKGNTAAEDGNLSVYLQVLETKARVSSKYSSQTNMERKWKLLPVPVEEEYLNQKYWGDGELEMHFLLTN